MADKILKSITFPNLPDKYIVPETVVDPVPTQNSMNAASSGGVYDEFVGLKQSIISGKVSIGAGTADILPSASDFQVAKITPKNGNVIANSTAYMNIDGVGAGYHTLMSTDFLSDDIKSIQSAYSSIKFVLFVYDKTTSEYLGAIFDGYVYKNISDLTSSNTLYPYSEINMDTVRKMFSNYKYKLEITDSAVNGSTFPTTSDVLNWCTYTVPRATSERQLVKTINNITPDNSGNINIDLSSIEEDIAGIAEDVEVIQSEIAGIGDVAQDINDLRQEIIDGQVIIPPNRKRVFTSNDFRKGIINTSTGNVNGNSTVRVSVDGTNKLLYGIAYLAILPSTITSILSTGSAYIFVVAYDKNDTDTEYIGYYTGSGFEKPIGVVADTQYIDFASLSAEYPDYRFKLMVVDVSTTDPLDIPTVASKVFYTEPSEQGYRQLVMTINNTTPDSYGNIELNIIDSIDSVPTQGSTNAVQSGGVKTALDTLDSEVDSLKQDIITGVVSIGAGTADILPSASDFQNAKITPKNGNIVANGNAYMNVGGVGNTYYPLISTDFLPDDIKAIQGSYSDVKFVLFVYDKTTSEYLGAIFDGYVYKSVSDLTASNTLYPYSEVNMGTVRTMFPDYKYKLEITDTAVNHDNLPTTADVTTWCTYSVPSYASERQLVKTVNGTAPDNAGNISLTIPEAEEIEGYIAETYEHVTPDSSAFSNGFYRYDTGIGNTNYLASIIPKGEQYRHSYYGVIFKEILHDNIYRIATSGTKYALIAGWDRTDGSFVGYYTGAGFEIPTTINANNVDTQNVNLKELREEYPNYFFKVSFVDVSTYDRPDMDDVLDSVAFVYESASKYELGKVSDTNIPELPEYWADFLDEKIETIRGNMTSAGRNGETFIFITDLHWPNNVKNSPRLMFEILRRLNIHHCICGGDVINEGTREESVSVMVDVVNAFKHYDIDFLTAIGNHDRNWNIYNNQRSFPERRFSEADVFSLLERMSKQVYQNFADDKFDNGIGFNMYYDDPITQTRFIIIDINDGIVDSDTGTQSFEFTNYAELAQVLHDSNGKHVVIISHILESGSGIGTKLATISDALNARATVSTDYCTADFTRCTGNVHLIVGGHAHSDSSRLSSGGIPIVICDTDSNLSHNTDAHIDGTTKEQAFDVITVNYADNSVKFVRIGRGADRSFVVGN